MSFWPHVNDTARRLTVTFGVEDFLHHLIVYVTLCVEKVGAARGLVVGDGFEKIAECTIGPTVSHPTRHRRIETEPREGLAS